MPQTILRKRFDRKQSLSFFCPHRFDLDREAGLPDKSLHNIPKLGKYTKLPINFKITIKILNDVNIFRMPIEYANFFISRPSKIYPNWDFWFEMKTCHLATLQ
jgi:hypothetical protein